MKKIIGWFIVFLPAIAFFIWIGIESPMAMLVSIGTIAVIVGCVILGIKIMDS